MEKCLGLLLRESLPRFAYFGRQSMYLNKVHMHGLQCLISYCTREDYILGGLWYW